MKTLIITIIIICTQLINISGQTVIANFEVDTTEGCGSIVVNFINNSTPTEGLSYEWDFGNGTSSSLKNPTVAYTQPGTYSVKLTVTDGSSTDILLKENYISVYSAPIVNIGIEGEESGCAPHSLQFIDNSVSGDGIINNWKWDFGDGSICTEQNPTHSFLYQSNFSVSLIVTDSNNCSGIGNYNNLISVYKPKSDFLADPLNSCAAEIDVNFYNNSNGDGTLNYYWYFGDGTSSTETQPNHTYTSNGNYDVKLIVFDEHECSDTLVKNDYIELSGVNANFSVEKNILCPNEDVLITNNTTGAISYYWDFGDGFYSEQKTPSHKYSTPGNYVISLTANHQFGCSETYSVSITVENVIANFYSSDNFSCEVPAIVNYTNNSLNAVSYEWSFGENLASTEENPSITYNKKGIYSTTLKVTSAHGCKASKTIDSCMNIAIPRAYFTPNIWVDEFGIKGCAPLTVNFENKSIYVTDFDNVDEYHWVYGDGEEGNTENPTHIYNNVGEYLVQFYFTTTEGCTSIPYSATAKVGTPQTSDFYKTLPDTICANQEIQFFDNSEDAELINDWLWLFGDTKYSRSKNPTHTYIDTGYMNVTLQSYYNGCPSVNTKENFIYIKGPIVDMVYNVECENPYTANLNSNAIDAEKVYWDFGDGSPIDSSGTIVSHTFPENKEYTINLISKNNTNNCSFSSSKKILINDIKANYKIDKTIGCENLFVTLNSDSSQDISFFHKNGIYGKYFWDFGDGTTLMTDTVIVKHIYKNKGLYPLKLLVKDFRGCEDTIIKNVHIYKPDVNLNTSEQNGCMPMEVGFNSLVQSDTTVTQLYWSFGDATYSNIENPTHVYNSFGIYDVSLYATDALGCVGAINKNKYIEVLKPTPDFFSNDNTICLGDTINFIPIDTSRIASFHWDFGDGNISNELSPSHIYNSSGHYSVTLTLVDKQGCDSTNSINDYVYIQDIPDPNFSSSDKFSDCYPFNVNFTDTTNNNEVIDWFWNFGDGETSSHLKNPIHIYTAPGLYNVKLNVATENGCIGSLLKQNYIDIKGPYAEMNIADTLCKNSEGLFIANNKKDIYELQWIFGDGNTSYTDSIYHSYNEFGYMHPVLLLKSDNLGTCDIYLTDSIYIPPLSPKINSNDSVFSGCIPFSFNLSNNCTNADNWLWDFNDGTYSTQSNPSHIYETSGIRNVKLIVSNNFGCKDSSSVSVEAFALPVITTNDTIVCRGDEIVLKANGAENYKWFPKSYLDGDSSNPISRPDASITYSVIGTDTNGCVNSSDLKIFVQQEPKVNIEDTAVIIGEHVILNAFSEDILNYSWSPDYNISCNDCPQTIVTPLEPTNYEVTVEDVNGCFSKSYDVFVDVLKKYTIDVPSAFTPNGDGINDKIFIKGWGIENLIIFRIFNRYGEIVFETSDKNIGWDGTYKGKMQGTETFTYIASVQTYGNNIISKRGTIKLLK